MGDRYEDWLAVLSSSLPESAPASLAGAMADYGKRHRADVLN